MRVVFLSLPIIITLLCSVWLFFLSNKKSISLKLLGLFFFFFSVVLFAILFQYLQEFYPSIRAVFPYFEIGFYMFMITLPVLVYFYVLSLTDYIKTYQTIDKYLPHLWVPLLSLLFNIYSFAMQGEKDTSIYQATEFFNFFSLKVIFVLFNIYYITRVIMIYKRHRTRLKQVLSYDHGISLSWILLFLLGYVLFVLCFFILNPDSSPYVVYLPLVLILAYLFFQRQTQINISLEDQTVNVQEITVHAQELKSKVEAGESSSSPLDLEKRQQLKSAVIAVMQSQEPYLKNDLSIYELSKMVGTNNTYLSFVLNNDFKSNFSSFINSYRVAKAKELLVSGVSSKYTIETIGENVGFHSKSAFNAAFKRIVGMPPSTYRKRNSID